MLRLALSCPLCALMTGLLAIALVACDGSSKDATPDPTVSAHPATRPTGAFDPDTRDALRELMKGHDDKVELGWYATSILRRLDPPAKAFATRMHDTNKALRDQLRAWARARHVDLKFTFTNDLTGRARKRMEDAQGKVIQSDANADFQRDMLFLMYTDHNWELSLIETMQAATADADLKAYLAATRKYHEDAIHEINDLLKHYKYQ